MNIRTRLMFLVLLATLLPAALIGLRFIQDRAENVEMAKQHLGAASNSLAVRIASSIQGTAQLHYGLARAKDLDTNDKMACSSFLSDVREANPQYTGILTITPDGQLFCDSLLTGRTLDLRDRGYFRQALVTTKGVTLEPVFGKVDRHSGSADRLSGPLGVGRPQVRSSCIAEPGQSGEAIHERKSPGEV